MSLELSKSKPPIEVFSIPTLSLTEEKYILIQGVEIPLEDFVTLVMYVMCNIPLKENDPRLELIEEIKDLRRINFNGQDRLIGGKPLGAHFSTW